MTNTALKTSIDAQITNQTSAGLTTHANVGNRIKDVIDYTDQEINTLTTYIDTEIASVSTPSLGYNVYTAIITQSGTNAPVATVFTNTLGGTVVWTRTSSGVYEGTLVGAFVNNKVFFILTPINVGIDYSAFSTSEDVIQIKSWNNQTAAFGDGLLNETSLEIRVYP